MKKVNWSIVVIIVFFVIVLGFIISLVTAFYGNPITKAIATAQIRSYVAETYPDMNLEVTKAVYNFKFKEYFSNVQSITSMDTAFRVSWVGGKVEDDYEITVLGGYSTYQRLQRELNDIVEETIAREFPYETSIVIADADKSADDFSVLTLNMALDTSTFPLNTILVVYFYQDEINYELFCERLKELYDIMKRNKIRIDFFSVVMEETPEEGEKPTGGESIHLFDFPAEKINSDTLSEDVQKHIAEWEGQHEK